MNRFVAGIDVGSLATKAVVISDTREIVGHAVVFTGGDNRASAGRALDQAVEKAGLAREDVSHIVSTGYGRENVPFANRHVTEISAHAAGVNSLIPEARTILDIGGQDSKTIRTDGKGRVLDFMMNDRCAAGTGRFLEVIARALEVDLSEMGALSEQATLAVKISSMCAVFAESEVVSLVAKGTPVPNILRGVHDAIATRSLVLLRKVGIVPPVAMSGGVALNRGLVRCLEEKMNAKINIPAVPQIVGALGGALIGLDGR